MLKLASSNDELVAAITKQHTKIEQQEHKITELIAALRASKEERIDPDQLLLFEIGELEKLIDLAIRHNRNRLPSANEGIVIRGCCTILLARL